MRVWPVVSSLAVLASAAPSVAHAELGGGTLAVELKTPSDPAADAGSTDEGDFIVPTEDARLRYFNLARCVCDDTVADQNYHLRVSWATQPAESVAGTQIFVYAGSGCEAVTNPADRDARCTQLEPIPDAADVRLVVKRFESVRTLLTPAATSTACDPNVTATALGFYTSSDGGTTLTPETVVEVSPVDMRAPAVPDRVTVSAQEGQITLGWSRISSGTEDYAYFQALCAVGGAPAHDEPTHATRFDTVASVCGAGVAELEGATVTNPEDVTGTPVTFASLPAALARLDATFVCGQATGGSATSVTLGGLANGVEYTVVLVAMDKAGNYSARYVPTTITPQPVTDFWEDLNEENPDVEGGLCLVEATLGGGGGALLGALRAWRDELATSAAGRWLVARYYAWGAPLAELARESVVARVVLAVALLPLVAVALVWHALGLPLLLALTAAALWWRRRRAAPTAAARRRRLRLALAAAVVVAPAVAAAQSATPYWDDDLAMSTAVDPEPAWHFGLRLGPFTPSIDDDRFASPGPYERMFGSGSWMPAIDLHRLFATRIGQVGAGVSVGYFSKTALAYVPGTDMRAEGNENTLRIIPFEATAIWRATGIDDRWGVPLVPYLRGGLGYSLWWVRRPDGDLAKACPPDFTNCDRAIGGSLGLVGAAGLAIRAEGIDPSAARSMRDSGLEHAGFYAEVVMAWVDGFGSAKKLSLGDTTWFAGIDFEF